MGAQRWSAEAARVMGNDECNVVVVDNDDDDDFDARSTTTAAASIVNPSGGAEVMGMMVR